MIFNRHWQDGYLPYEEISLMILEQYGMGYYNYRREIEIITQTVKRIFYEKTDYIFDINKQHNCNIPWADVINIDIRFDFRNIYGEYVPEYLCMDEDGNVDIPDSSNDDNYDYTRKKIKTAFILIHLDKDEFEFDEVKYRQTIAHELVHLRDDYELRKMSSNEISFLRDFATSFIDNEYLTDRIRFGDKIAYIIYRLFIDTEWHAFSSQIYNDLYSLYKNNGYNLDRKRSSLDIKRTDTFQTYLTIRDDYKCMVKTPMFANKAILYFPRWVDKFNNYRTERKKRDEILTAFKRWFCKLADLRLKTVYSRIIKIAGILYDDVEDTDPYTLENFTRRCIVKRNTLNEILNELNSSYPEYKDEHIFVLGYDKVKNRNVKIPVSYNPIIESVN